jgi:hypothetical protein
MPDGSGDVEMLMKEEAPKLQTNLITFCSNVLKVYTLGESCIELRVSTQFNDKILDIIKVPTAPFVKKQINEGDLGLVRKPAQKNNL